ncbi:protein FAM98B [Drosophila rhopaloa]|uniref:Uncharacterized protein F12A10.7 n=1 Tax=Drosophila rhopaloa TaxID=1041015 RepID=A0A6P4G2V5_DRORH|nr:protein FAM98B [Drosophila rhopaloa]
MQFILFVSFLALLGRALAQPVDEDPAPPVTLEDVADFGGQGAKEGERPARWLSGGWGGGWNSGWGGGWNGGWGGSWNGGWNNGWSVSYRPWSNYWW